MKTKEFLKKVEELGYIVEEGIASYNIRLYKELGGLIATLNKKDQYRMLFFTKPGNDIEKLFKLCVEYAWTPLGEREEEKRYYLRKINKKFYEGEYLNHDINYNRWFLGDNTEHVQYKTKFTWKEIEDIKKKFNTELCEFVKEVAE